MNSLRGDCFNFFECLFFIQKFRETEQDSPMNFINVITLTLVLASPDNKTKLIPQPNLKVAFLADQGINENSVKVLRLVKSEKADLLLHQGDFDYTDDPKAWTKMLDTELGEKFPVFASVGNHDTEAWDVYREQLEKRIKKNSGAKCEGEVGVNLACSYKGLFFVNSGVGTLGKNHASFLEKQLKRNAVFKICAWHKNQRLMSPEGKKDETGWEVYEICRKAGAIIATAHSHNYSRTHTMKAFQPPAIVNTGNMLVLKPGQTFVFISGLGGHTIREQDDILAANPWWAKILTATQKTTFGALFCSFNVGGVPSRASCYFKDIHDEIDDRFEIKSDL